MKRILLLAFISLAPLSLLAQSEDSSAEDSYTEGETEEVRYEPRISGTVRGKGEFLTGSARARLQVRNARLSVSGNVAPIVSYKVEVDLCDEGVIKMLDAYAAIKSAGGLRLRIGQMRVPFTIDAHRSPHQQFFANRSFIAKQVGNVRDVGLYGACSFAGVPLKIEAGLFNGSGLTNQKEFFTSEFNFSSKAELFLQCGLTLVASVQKLSPCGVDVFLYDAGAGLHRGRWRLEAEYLRKNYSRGAFEPVNAFDAFAVYDLPIEKTLRKVSFLCRYDMMGDHSDGTAFTVDDTGNSTGVFAQSDASRHRVTAGVTLSLARKMDADVRINYEKYFYDDISLAKASENDKAVVELIVRF